jgi:hypothetical protein
MQVRRYYPIAAALALLLIAPFSRATTVIQPTFSEMVGAADYIVRIEVKSVSSAWRDDPSRPGERYIGSRIELAVREVIMGSPPNPLVLDVVGGRVGEDELVIDGAPRLQVGDECILFVRGNGRTFFPTVGLMHGYFPVYRDAQTKRASVLRFNGQPLRSESELEPGAARVGNANTPALTPEAFRDRIRQQHQRNVFTREQRQR